MAATNATSVGSAGSRQTSPNVSQASRPTTANLSTLPAVQPATTSFGRRTLAAIKIAKATACTSHATASPVQTAVRVRGSNQTLAARAARPTRQAAVPA